MVLIRDVVDKSNCHCLMLEYPISEQIINIMSIRTVEALCVYSGIQTMSGIVGYIAILRKIERTA